MMNLEQYRVFYQVCREGSITAAAKVLCVSQPAVSQALKQLEEGLGCELFVRIPRGVRPTQAGELLYTYVSKGLESILEGEERLRKLNNLEEGEVRIGASDMTLRFFLLPYLESFHEAYPRVKVTVTNGPTPETLAFLGQGRIDFGVVTAPFTCKNEVRIRPVRKIRDCFIAGEKFQKLQGKMLRYEDLTRLPVICLEKNTSTRRFLDDYLAGHHVTLQPEFELATSDMIVQFAARNLGIGCVMRDFAEDKLRQGEVFRLCFQEEMPEREICIVTDTKNALSPAAKRLIDQMWDIE
jgi:DNA-binding transcriptional LysR family regulator